MESNPKEERNVARMWAIIEGMRNRLPKWSVPKVLHLLRKVDFDEVIETLPINEIRIDVFEDTSKLREVLDLVYKRLELREDVYGKVDQIIDIIRILENSPEVNNQLTIEQKLETEAPRPYTTINGVAYLSKNDFLLSVNYFFRLSKFSYLATIFLKKWMVFEIGNRMASLHGCYEYVPNTALKVMAEDFFMPLTTLPFIRPLKIDHFVQLRDNLPFHEYDFFENVFMKKVLEMNAKTPIETHQHVFIASYVQIVATIQRSRNVLWTFRSFFAPSREIVPEFEGPLVRIIENDLVFAKELDQAFRITMSKKYPNRQYIDNLFEIETEEERQLGIILAVPFERFVHFAKLHELDISKDFDIVTVGISKHCCAENRGNYDVGIPFISPYGTLCKTKYSAYRQIVNFLTNNMRILVGEYNHINEVVEWLSQYEKLFKNRTYRFFIEEWKIDEILRLARTELSCYSKQLPLFHIPSEAEKNRLLLEIQQFGGKVRCQNHPKKNAKNLTPKQKMERKMEEFENLEKRRKLHAQEMFEVEKRITGKKTDEDLKNVFNFMLNLSGVPENFEESGQFPSTSK
ncbi:unnamed protein product [Caenorhabditis angaria]|uniref:Uncharacterized protein n=1 Tax=Caenorhabditis angaria TaxID=860376 RepID=A0A9P1N4F9_9PELO|nr:unnamed protein product [Caenorhabditis angaria]